MTPELISSKLEKLLPRVQRPARYVGGELHQVVKPWDQTPLRVALAFPDIYDIGMPNTGLAILYDIINRQHEMLAERVYLPWTDMQQLMREHGVPLYALESRQPVRAFDILGVSLPYESLYTNVLSLLDLAEIPLLAADRNRSHPLVVAGGHATFNPEPMGSFIDAFVIGEGEEVVLDIAHCVARWKASGVERVELLRQLCRIEGVYVPSLYRASYHPDGRIAQTTPQAGEDALAGASEAPAAVRKRIVARLPPPVTRVIVPNVDTVHNRVTVEIMRGCTRGCRFCHAGIVTRPVRERPVEEVVDALEEALDSSGLNEVGLLSLSSSDYTHVLELVNAVRERFAGRELDISLPSLRIESFSIELMEALAGSSRRGGFTLAPEAASERMREIINKPVTTDQVLETAREIYQRGWHTIKLYFMIGHPAEELEDVEAIAELCKAVLAEGRAALGGRAKVHAGVSTFVPKPHTPFQWVPCDSPEKVRAKQALLQQRLRSKQIKLSWTNPDETMLEAWLSRGDRRLSEVILEAYRLGARFDAWREHFRHDLWEQAFAKVGLDPRFYTHRQRELDEVFPWDHIDCAVDKSFLREDYLWSQEGRTRVDCRDQCFACGILPKLKELRRQTPGPAWQCPEVGRSAAKAKLVKHDDNAASTTTP